MLASSASQSICFCSITAAALFSTAYPNARMLGVWDGSLSRSGEHLVLRDGRKMSFDVMPRPAPANTQMFVERAIEGARGQPGRGFSGVVPLPGLVNGPNGGALTLVSPNGERRIDIRTGEAGPNQGERFRDMEFATLSEKLGGYFGVKSGVTVPLAIGPRICGSVIWTSRR